ncbi:DUF397 domain-containing protein [Streptomyces sp. Tu 2975]|uniref:DUF397 domain-containing protein n=1 Tax=Streptomyces sp. Tu 2975 TaxID=2676871 RepID=UPI00135A2162|nr:DUF397 domain-containing protein [Streptomyces sp. Tu 2975]QIP86738.1 DUF397 domain-containing protein [Streptomyces sp. Tu 2975]
MGSTTEWRKSTYSGDQGGSCVECAPLGSAAWQRSSYSDDKGGECVECADVSHGVAVRDSKDIHRPALHVSRGAFAAFVAAAARGELRAS